MASDDYQTRMAILEMEISRLKEGERRLHDELDEMKRVDQNRIRAAVVALGAAVIAMGGYIWNGLIGPMR